jgi:hypothetical protein
VGVKLFIEETRILGRGARVSVYQWIPNSRRVITGLSAPRDFLLAEYNSQLVTYDFGESGSIRIGVDAN